MPGFPECDKCGGWLAEHPQRHVEYPAGLSACIDEEMAPLVVACWQARVRTAESCQHFDDIKDDRTPAPVVDESRRRLVFLSFDRLADYARFAEALFSGPRDRLLRAVQEPEWVDGWDWTCEPVEYDKDGGEARPVLNWCTCVTFPAVDIEAVTVRLREFARGPELYSYRRVYRAQDGELRIEQRDESWMPVVDYQLADALGEGRLSPSLPDGLTRDQIQGADHVAWWWIESDRDGGDPGLWALGLEDRAVDEMVEWSRWDLQPEASRAGGPSLNQRRAAAGAPRLGEPWTEDEVAELRREHAAGMRHHEIAPLHGRQPSAIWSRLVTLGLESGDPREPPL